MIIVKVWGGIGNQLFQYVFGQYLKYKFKQEVFYDNNSFITNDKLRKPELYAIDAEIAYDNRCNFSKYRGIKNRVLRYLFQINPRHHFITENSELPKYFNLSELYFFQGYWQDIKYYDWLCNNVPSFSISSNDWPLVLQNLRNCILSEQDSVSIHIRRGDYFKPENVKVYGVCDADYFHNSIAYIKKVVPTPRLYVFTDDIDWVKGNIELPTNSVIVPNYDISQFAYIELMSLCKHHIISNSSFSWWGAVINVNQEGVVVSPAKWTLTSSQTIALEKWHKIS